jgi:DNA-binding HxlR family transcriptional regulator
VVAAAIGPTPSVAIFIGGNIARGSPGRGPPSVVLYALREGPLRPGELRERIGGISHKVLNETLRRLERNGLVARHRYAEAPPRVEYELTGPGRGLLEPILALGRWAELYADEVIDAQERALDGP